MVYHSLLLREQAKLESDPAVLRKLTEEADAVRQRAVEVINARRTQSPAAAPHAALAPLRVDGAFRVGGDVKAPVVRRRVEPIIPEAARKARIPES